MSRQPGFFDVDKRLKRLSDLGDQLEAFAAAVDFALFRPALDTALAYPSIRHWPMRMDARAGARRSMR